MYEAVTIDSDIRYEMTGHVIPAAADFVRTIGGFASLADIDCMDGIRLEEAFYEDDFDGIYRLEYKAGEKRGHISASFITYPAAELWEIMRISLDALGMAKASICPSVYYLYSDEKMPEQERTKWTAKLSFEAGEDLYAAFIRAHGELINAVRRCFRIYKLFEEVKDLRSDYSEFYRIKAPIDMDLPVEGINPYGTLYAPFFLGDRYYRTTEDHGVFVEKIFDMEGADAVFTTVHVKKDMLCRSSAVNITCETLAEDDLGEPYKSDFECRQSFSIANACGNDRALLHNDEVIAMLRFIRPNVCVLQPLSVYLAEPLEAMGRKEKLKYLIVTRDSDDKYSFFAEIAEEDIAGSEKRSIYQHRMIAWAGLNSEELQDAAGNEKGEEKYEVSILYELRRLLPLVVATIEDWTFAPSLQREIGYEHITAGNLEESRFRKLNEDGGRLISIVTKWLGDDRESVVEFVSCPGTKVLNLLRRERPDLLEAFHEGRDRELLEDVYFVQRIKNISYGIVDSDNGLSSIRSRLNAVGLGNPPGCRQIAMTDMLETDRYPEREKVIDSE